LSHGPCYGILDKVQDATRHPQGCEMLRKKVFQLSNLKLHACGHIHEAYGQMIISDVHFVNSSICTGKYEPTNLPIVIDL
jgi:Icc-related predicted phosphoesterase